MEKRNTVIEILTEAGFKPTIPEGTPFVIADWSHWGKCIPFDVWFIILEYCTNLLNFLLAEKYSGISSERDREADLKFALWLTKHVRLWGTPLSIFSAREHKLTGKYIRFCFFKVRMIVVELKRGIPNWTRSIFDKNKLVVLSIEGSSEKHT